jgi:histidinol-phosphate aminotransferase
VAQAAALAALDDREHRIRSCEAARIGIAALTRGISALGLHVLPSVGNFVLVDLDRDAGAVHQGLLRRGIIARPMASWGLPRHLRISLAAPADVDRAVDALRAVLAA